MTSEREDAGVTFASELHEAGLLLDTEIHIKNSDRVRLECAEAYCHNFCKCG